MVKSRYRSFMTWGVIILATVFIVRHFWTNREEITVITKVSLSYQISFLLFYLTVHTLIALKMLLIFKALGLKEISFYRWFKIFSISRLANLYMTQGANIYRALKLKKEHNFSYQGSISMITFFAWYESIMIMLFSAVVIAVLDRPTGIGGIGIWPLLLAGVVLLAGIPTLAKRFLDRMRFQGRRTAWLHDKLCALASDAAANMTNARLMGRITMLSVVIYTLYIVWFRLCFVSLGIDASPAQTTVFMAATLLSRIVNVIPGNVGLREVICGYLGLGVGLSIGQGILASALVRAAEYIVVVLLGVVFARTIMIRKEFEGTNPPST